jgi:hypothetical protein
MRVLNMRRLRAMSGRDDAQTVARVAAYMENVAAQLENLLPAVREARDALSGMAPGAARHAGFEGSVDQYDAEAADGYGFARVEAARRRLVAILADPFDEFLRHEND